MIGIYTSGGDAMTPERAWKTVLDAAVVQWSANTKQGELREALDLILDQVGDNTLSRALALRWSKTDHRGRPLIGGLLS
jgi:hypothetical protein